VPCFICKTCGVQSAKSERPPSRCPICEDDRQYIGSNGQEWTTQDELHRDYRNRIVTLEPDLYGIGTEPSFAIGQRALLVCSPRGNTLWDCISLVDDETVRRVNELGGIDTIAISHPHFYSAMVDWAGAFDARVLVHEADRQWVGRPHSSVQFWEGDQYRVHPDISLVHAGGHFPGSTVCHWRVGAEGAGVLLTGDTIHVVADRRWVTFMHSVPNFVPLPASKVARVLHAVDALQFDRLYGGWWDYRVPAGAKETVRRSAERYIAAIQK